MGCGRWRGTSFISITQFCWDEPEWFEQIVEFPPVAGYPVGGDFEIKYYMVQMHYDNPHRMSSEWPRSQSREVAWTFVRCCLDRTDSSGIRFYLGQDLRQYDLGYLTLGADSQIRGISIPPRAERFTIDSYCPATATEVRRTLFSSLAHIFEFPLFRDFPKLVSPWSLRFRTRIFKVSLRG